ncbi:very low-density lipoprotein receptor-like [Stylophora pistillata]|uniref:very low-density lipoprotein receptor-like n=1 Tax=Stylophora pistillata TaxID=50429 RepID=UPI000C03A66C|nr:very low-density lipoprotein receptor-like [Stylophora pistillata]
MKCKTTGCKQNCNNAVQLCEMDLECSEGDCEQICNAKTCKLNCSGGKCKKQECSDKVKICEMDQKCGEGDCEQTCNAKTCKLNCSGGKCKKQECSDEVKICEMDLECGEGDCEQTCNAKTCKLNCSGGKCKKQHCSNGVEVCSMHCNAIDCTQTCDSPTCHMVRSWPNNPQGEITCCGSGGCCGSLMPKYDSLPFTKGVFHTRCDIGKHCRCTKCLNGSCSTSDLYISNIITPAFSTTDQVFSTQIPTVQRTGNSYTCSAAVSSLGVEASETAELKLNPSSESASTTLSVSLSSTSSSPAAASLFPSPSSSPPSSTWNIPSLTLEALRNLVGT